MPSLRILAQAPLIMFCHLHFCLPLQSEVRRPVDITHGIATHYQTAEKDPSTVVAGMEYSNDLGVAPLRNSKEAGLQTPLPEMKLTALFPTSVLRVPENHPRFTCGCSSIADVLTSVHHDHVLNLGNLSFWESWWEKKIISYRNWKLESCFSCQT